MLSDRDFSRRLLMIVAAALAVGLAWPWLAGLREPPPPPEPRVVTPRGDLADDEAATIELFEAARGSVVFIATQAQAVDPFTRNVFAVPRGTGSGFLWDDRGHVVTNFHVLEGASAARVRFADGATAPAALVGADPRNDLAVLRIEPEGPLPAPLAVGASGDLQVGQKVFAIGNPFGFDFSLTTGIVSALGRELPGEAGVAIRGLIQTDAAINPGNSGGPLLDSAGRLIGVNTAIYSPTGGSAGIGFAVPVDTVNRVVPQLIATGRYSPPVLGVDVDSQINELAARQGVDGVLVLGVRPGSPADAAGLRPARFGPDGTVLIGDVIVGLAGRAVEDVDDLFAALEAHSAGATVPVEVLRGEERLVVNATLAPG
jgi:S1-C subfamily serine protease